MAIYPKSDTDRRVPHSKLKKIVAEIFVRCSMSERDADLLAETLVHADLRGIHSHGVLRVPEYVRKLTTGGVNPAGRPCVASIHGGAIVVDGGNSMGQIGGTYAMREVIKTAHSTGVAFAAVRGSNHCGAMEWYTLLAAQENMIDRVLVPGELEASFERAYATEGIPLAATTINDIADQAERLRVDASMLFV